MKNIVIELEQEEMCNIYGGEEVRVYSVDENGNVLVKVIVT